MTRDAVMVPDRDPRAAARTDIADDLTFRDRLDRRFTHADRWPLFRGNDDQTVETAARNATLQGAA
jgi:hypothetical protein